MKRKARNLEYLGGPNAFSIEIAATNPDHDDCLLNMFESAYDCFPDKDYCVMTKPTTEQMSSMLNFFVEVSPKFDSSFPHTVYLMHKNSILSKVHVKVKTNIGII